MTPALRGSSASEVEEVTENSRQVHFLKICRLPGSTFRRLDLSVRTAQRRRLAMGSFFAGVCMQLMLTTQSTDARITRKISAARLAVGRGAALLARLRICGVKRPTPTLPKAPSSSSRSETGVFEAWMWDRRHNSTSLAGFRAPLSEPTKIRRHAWRQLLSEGRHLRKRPTVHLQIREVYGDDALQVPWFPSLGDHDHLGDVNAQSMYSLKSDRWSMP